MNVKDAFLPLLGELVWSVHRGHGTFLTMEFGLPHRIIREPIVASKEASARVKRNLAKRRVTIVGDWHFWIEMAHWEVKTTNCSVSDHDVQAVKIDEALHELDGQKLLSVGFGEQASSCILRFDLGGFIHIFPYENYQHSGKDSETQLWSISHFNTQIVYLKADGTLTTYKLPK
ncbi:MAG: hypothetical protein JO216_18405 [Hyphomicrobiales bacterium]|nr:hypothetical protein [Hyphomicrobiales bacterium]